MRFLFVFFCCVDVCLPIQIRHKTTHFRRVCVLFRQLIPCRVLQQLSCTCCNTHNNRMCLIFRFTRTFQWYIVNLQALEYIRNMEQKQARVKRPDKGSFGSQFLKKKNFITYCVDEILTLHHFTFTVFPYAGCVVCSLVIH